MDIAVIAFIGLVITVHVTLQKLKDGIQGDDEQK
jgi:uncharacterized protein YoxC